MWVLSTFEKGGDRMVGELQLRNIAVNTLRQLLQQPDDDPMCYTYPVSSDAATVLSDYIEGRLEISMYDYFLDYRTDTT